ncbi:hypothetical protein MNBD_NITROSPINAE04-969 [hydrothermal vent metagenome]|uniref:Rubrerythrin diiron-binding domain-containing protein n=1 Tax=hydrothermal vent metagenome TaxID=652676 RepID=A0A3B1CDL6_9ZZZZ
MELKPEGEVTQRDILEFAIDTERKAAQMYLTAADCVTDEKARALLIELADEERKHEIKLSELMEKVEAGGPLDNELKLESIKKNQEVFGKTSLPANTTTKDALQFGIEREKAMMELYEVFSHLISAGVFSELLTYLANEERGHLKKLEELLAQQTSEAK